MDFLYFLINTTENIFFSIAVIFSGVMLVFFSFFFKVVGISAMQTINMINRKQAILIDIRSVDEFKNGHIAQARNIPIEELKNKVNSIGVNKNLILVCANGNQSIRAISQFYQYGFKNVLPMLGGMRVWNDLNLPVIKN